MLLDAGDLIALVQFDFHLGTTLLREAGRTLGNRWYVAEGGDGDEQRSGVLLEPAPAAGAVVRDDLLEHRSQRRGVERLTFVDGDRPGGLVVVAAR